ncbi:MAG: hypothetical protein JW958_08245 [Candidatus Eisenbacteria bacterium]|nr:hypothetical protein [Candidatus Eisenbacteria bacterium]
MKRVSRLTAIPLLLILAAPALLSAQEEDPVDLIRIPTAGMLPRAAYDTGLRMYADGGVLGRIRVGLRESVLFGFTFGGSQVLGAGEPDWNPRVEFLIRGRLFGESYLGPALAIGYDSQGYGPYDDELDRYQNKSRGFYAVASKHFLFLGELGLHGGVNYSLERDDDDDELNPFFGVEKSIHRALDLLVEYDLATNDNEENEGFGEGKGFLSAALLWRMTETLHFQVDFHNLLENGERGGLERDPGEWSREIQIVYRDYF